MKWNAANLSKTLLSLVAVLSVFVWINEHTSLLIAQSESLPYRYLLLLKNTQPHRGDLIAIQSHPVHGLEDKLLTKKLVGLPNDEIVIHNRTIWVDEWQGLLKRKRRNGKPLTPLSVTIIPEGFVFAAGNHADSLDSRYEEFGLVSQKHILGRVVGLW